MTVPAVKTAAKQFAHDIANHAMTVMHDDGPYRHLRFTQPSQNGYWFDIVTWPGSLAVRGDMGGGYVFSRLTDMFEFFRANGNDHGINPDYWAKKLPNGRRAVKEHSEDKTLAVAEQAIADYARDLYPELVAAYTKAQAAYEALPSPERRAQTLAGRTPIPPTTPAEAQEMVSDAKDDGHTMDATGAHNLLRELEDAGVTSDTWERDLSDWSYEFLWFCHAIVWGIRQYDAARASRAVASA